MDNLDNLDIQVKPEEVCEIHFNQDSCRASCISVLNETLMLKAVETGQLTPIDAQRSILLKMRVADNLRNATLKG